MRTIKFRVWDEETSKMYAGNDAIVTFSGELEEVYVRRNNMVDELIDYKLMQSTGMKDTKVNEIYEGDVVEVKDSTPTAKHFGKTDIGIVKYECSEYVVNTKKGGIRMSGGLFRPDLKVIGNVYENPELIG